MSVATRDPISSPDTPDHHHRPMSVSDPGSLAVAAWQPIRGPFQRWPRFMDLTLACLAFLLTLMSWSAGSDMDPVVTPSEAFSLLLAVIGNFALIWRRRYPVHVHVIVIACSAAVTFGPVQSGLFAVGFSLYSLGRYAAHDRVSLLGMLAALLLATLDMFVLNTPNAGSFVALGFVVLFWYVGRRLRFRGEYLRLLEERAEYLENRKSEEAARAVAEERTRIARELHDVVAHQVSLMTVQAGAAKTVAGSDPEAALVAMAAVEGAGRQAMREMRHLLDVLRQDDGQPTLHPQPGCADLLQLAAEVTEAGAVVDLHTEGRLSGLAARVDLALYRIVQESLTNVLRHAGPGVRATVRVHAMPTGVDLQVSDDGIGPSQQLGHPQGYGINGMRERAELLGGWLTAQSGAQGGFQVAAFLPYADSSR
ncbi:MAG: sensor histidine kinase [Congregibacter sp.]